MHYLFCGIFRSICVAVLIFSIAGTECLCDSSDDSTARHMSRVLKRAEQGYVDQQIELAAAYMSGRGVPQDLAMAAHWYEKAAEGGDPEAQNEIGYFYHRGIGVRADLDRAFHWFQLSSASGLSAAKVNLGVAYLYGLGTAKNASTARELFTEAATKGAGIGATYLGVMNLFGIGTPVDRTAAENWFKLGVRLHDAEAAYDLAFVHCDLSGSPHDLDRAVDLMRLSASRGYVPGKHMLGFLLVSHPELALTDKEARQALEDASGAGNWRSSALLGILHRDGSMGKADPARAYYYFHLAALQGGEQAARTLVNDLNQLESELAPEIRTRVAADGDSWFQQHRVALVFVFKSDDVNRKFPVAAIPDVPSRGSSGE